MADSHALGGGYPGERASGCRSLSSASLGSALAVLLIALSWPPAAGAFPSDSQFIPMQRAGAPLQDDGGDTNGPRNIVSTPTQAAGFLFNDGTNLFYRIRVDVDPAGSGGQGLLRPFGWGFVLDTDGNADNYEFLLEIDGISNPEAVNLWRNTVQGTLGEPSDKPEVLLASIPLNVGTNFRIVAADSAVNGDQDFFIDFAFPLATFNTQTGLGVNSPLRYFEGSSANAGVINDRNGDLVGATDLAGGFTDPVLVSGTTATTGQVRFVADLAGNGDVTTFVPGNPLFLRVDDADQNASSAVAETVPLTLTSTGGDSLTLVLRETGVNTGVFTVQVTTEFADSVADAILQARVANTVTASFLDLAAAGGGANQTRTDSVLAAAALGQNGTLQAPATLVPGDPLSLTVTDADLDTSATTVQTVVVLVANAATGETEDLILTETGVQTGVFTGALPTAHGTAVGTSGDGTLRLQGLQSIESSYADQLTSTGGAATRTASTRGQAPVIVVTKTADKVNVQPGDQLAFSLSFRNDGDSAARDIAIVDRVPPFSLYVAGSAAGPPGTTVAFSHDNAATFDSSETSPITHVRWLVPGPIASSSGGAVSFSVRIE